MSRTIALASAAMLAVVAARRLWAQQPTAPPHPAPAESAAAAEQPMRFAIADEIVKVRQGHYRSYQFSVSIPSPCTVRGQIVGLAGGNKDFQASIMDKDNFLNWKSHHEAQVYWVSGQVAATDLGVRLYGPTTYYLVISNLFSRFTAKTVRVQAFTEC
jgi:hypothetical protein